MIYQTLRSRNQTSTSNLSILAKEVCVFVLPVLTLSPLTVSVWAHRRKPPTVAANFSSRGFSTCSPLALFFPAPFLEACGRENGYQGSRCGGSFTCRAGTEPAVTILFLNVSGGGRLWLFFIIFPTRLLSVQLRYCSLWQGSRCCCRAKWWRRPWLFHLPQVQRISAEAQIPQTTKKS